MSGVVPHLVRLAAPPVQSPVVAFTPQLDDLSCGGGFAALTLPHIGLWCCVAARRHGFLIVTPCEILFVR